MEQIVQKLISLQKTIATMESCSGGMIVNAITNVPGASSVLKYSAITYSNEFKIKFGVSQDVIQKYSVYSMEVASEMSKNISLFADADYGVGITGRLGVDDPNNDVSDSYMTYISIYDRLQKRHFNSKIQTNASDRILNKELLLNEVIKMLTDIIN